MCCLFGLIDIHNHISGSEKRRIFSILAEASEIRGTDATGYAYNSGGRLIIEKQPLPAHRMRIGIPSKAKIIMGHTRQTTQGSARKNANNHPFLGKVSDGIFALAHNGVLNNDTILRKNQNLPKTKIQTDSYIAVQLIEKENTLDLNAIKTMAEQVKGTFNFTILDYNDRLFIVRGNNPMCLYHFVKDDFYMYASTKAILEAALEDMGYASLAHKEVKLQDGEIVMIAADGSMTREHFTPPISYTFYSMYDFWEQVEMEPTGYRKMMIDYGVSLGIPKAELEWLHSCGFPDLDIEEAIFDIQYRRMCLFESGYYDENDEDIHNDDYFADFPWT